jgi:tRNA threonylcarbamoyladenosine biosynthesis protein TsaE
MARFAWTAATPADTDRLAAFLTRHLPDSVLVGLDGPLGAGKTHFVRALAASVGVDPRSVTSPTFVLLQEYASTRGPIYHGDAYRLQDQDEFLELGFDELIASPGWIFIEWASRVERLLPSDRLHVELSPNADQGRDCVITAGGYETRPIIEALNASLADGGLG